MYETYFGFKKTPFGKTPDPNFVFMSEQHEEAINRLAYAAENRETALLIGPIGSGKTTIIRALIDQLGKEKYEFCLVVHPVLKPVELLRSIAYEFGIEAPSASKVDLLRQIHKKLFSLHKEGKTAIVVIDEAQLLPKAEHFHDLRLLTNFQLDDQNLVSLILVGQPELKKRLSRSTYQAFLNRVGIHAELKALALEETQNMIYKRLFAGGVTQNPFTEIAISKIAEVSKGIPRSINHLCHASLISAYAQGVKVIDDMIILDVAGDLEGRSLFVKQGSHMTSPAKINKDSDMTEAEESDKIHNLRAPSYDLRGVK